MKIIDCKRIKNELVYTCKHFLSRYILVCRSNADYLRSYLIFRAYKIKKNNQYIEVKNLKKFKKIIEGIVKTKKPDYIIFETKFELSKEIIENFNLQFKIEDGLYIYNRKENFEKVL